MGLRPFLFVFLFRNSRNRCVRANPCFFGHVLVSRYFARGDSKQDKNIGGGGGIIAGMRELFVRVNFVHHVYRAVVFASV